MKKSYNFIGKVKYHLQRILFEKYAIPKVKNEKISKIILKDYLPIKPVIIDCGAHDGSDSIELAEIFKSATIHAFEPVELLYAKLKKNIEPYGNIYSYKIALADSNGTMNFFLSEGASDASSSLLKPAEHINDHPDTFFVKAVEVPTRTLDTWAKENNIIKVDMLWLDMQGFELRMLKGSHNILDSVSVIHTEVSTKETYEHVGQYAEYRKFLESKGFKVMVEAIPKGWDMGNVLFVKGKNKLYGR